MASSSIFLSLLIILLLSGFFPVGKPDLAGDKTALISLRDKVGMFLPWNKSDASPCNWQGVVCENGRVGVLRLPGVGLMGDLPSGVLGSLTALRTLSLRFNALTGSLPGDIGECAELRNLYLQENRLSGEIPSEIFKLQKLVRLNLAGNNFSGEIPAGFSNFTRLATLYLEQNQFSGKIPDLTLPGLVQFNVSYNNLSGSIPAALSKRNMESFRGNLQLCGSPLPPCAGSPSSSPVPNAGPSGSISNEKNSKGRLSGGAIAGIVIACAVVLLLLLCFCVWRVRKKNSWSKTGAIDMATVKAPPSNAYGDKHVADEEESAIAKEGNGVMTRAMEPASVAAAAATTAAERKLIFFSGTRQGFDLEDLLRASAEVLGKGTFGTAYKAVLEGGAVVAVKRLKDVTLEQMEFGTQIDKIGSMIHVHLVPLRAYYYSREEKLLVYDYMAMGSLSALLHGGRGAGRSPMGWEMRSRIALGAAKGIEYIHSHGSTISHGNIKSANILLTKDYDACVSDFGLAALVTSAPATNRLVGYRAPEVTDPSRVSPKADVYSFGVLLLELLTGKPPAHALMNDEGVDLPRWVQSVVREEWTSEVFDVELLRYQNVEEDMVHLLQLAMDCAANYPDQRPTMKEVVHRIEEIRGSAPASQDDVLRSTERTENLTDDSGTTATQPRNLSD